MNLKPKARQHRLISCREIEAVRVELNVMSVFTVQAYADYMGFILALNEGVKGKKLSWDYSVSEVQHAVVYHAAASQCLKKTSLVFMVLLMGFVVSLSLCAFQTVVKLLSLLETLDRWIDETPPVDQPSRFGNKAYRTWYARLEQVHAMLRLSAFRYLTQPL